MAVIMILGSVISFPMNISFAEDNSWKGDEIDVSWFEPESYDNTDIYEIDTPEKLMGLAALVNGLYNDNIKVVGGEKEAKKIGKEVEEDVLLIPFDGTRGDVYSGKYDFEGKTVKITKDLDMGGVYDTQAKTWKENSPNYMPIGGAYSMDPNDAKNTLIQARFNGVFDGQGHSIKNLYINRYTPMHFGYSQGLGIIGAVGQKKAGDKIPEQVVIKNLILESGFVYGRRMVGGIVGTVNNTQQGAIIENCINHATIKSTDKKGVGGIAGGLNDILGIIKNSYNTGTIINTGNFNAAGIAGELEGSVDRVYNTGEIISSIPGEIAKVTNATTAKGDNYYWLDNGKNISGLVEYGKEVNKDAKNFGKKTKEEMSSKKFVDEINNGEKGFYNEAGKFPKLLMEQKSDDEYLININQLDEKHGKIESYPAKKGKKGHSITIKEYSNPGYRLDKLVINEKETKEKSFILTEDTYISGKYEPLKLFNITIPTSDDYELKVTKKGIAKINDKLEFVEDYPVINGDRIYENDKIFTEIKKRNENLSYQISLTNTDKQTYDFENQGSYNLVNGDGDVAINVSPIQKPVTWTDFAETDWYDNNPSAKIFKIENHKQLAGLAKICNSTSKEYEDEFFEGKTIEITTDIRLRAENNRENKENHIWEPIKGFKGTFDGKNNRISHIEINGPQIFSNYNNIGFFGDLIGDKKGKPVVKNIILEGDINNNSGISTGNIGGLVGYADNAVIENATNEISIVNETYQGINIGGIAGKSNNTQMNNLKNYGEINSVRTIVGGIVGQAEGNAEFPIKKSMNYGLLYQGSMDKLGMDNSSKTGGIVGESYIPIEESGNKGSITGYNIVGGIVGESSSSIKNSYFNGEITFLDTPSLNSAVGSIVGLSTSNKNIVENTYSSGNINIDDLFIKYIGLVGNRKYKGKTSNSYYLENTLPGGINSEDVEGIEKLNLENMQNENFVNKIGNQFSKDEFNINKKYPVLNFENKYFEDISMDKAISEAMRELDFYVDKDGYEEKNLNTIKDLLKEFNNNVQKEKDISGVRNLIQEYKDRINEIDKKFTDDEEGKKIQYIERIKLSQITLQEKIDNKKIPETKYKEDAKNIIKKADEYINNKDIVSVEYGKLLKQMYDLTLNLTEDTKAPVFKNIDDIEIDPIENYDLKQGVIIVDEYDGAPSPTFSIDEKSLSKFDSNKPGVYTIVYIGRDSVGNETKYTRKVTVKGDINYDLNNDGKINSLDVNILEKAVDSDTKNIEKYDLNSDGRINSIDINLLERKISNN